MQQVKQALFQKTLRDIIKESRTPNLNKKSFINS